MTVSLCLFLSTCPPDPGTWDAGNVTVRSLETRPKALSTASVCDLLGAFLVVRPTLLAYRSARLEREKAQEAGWLVEGKRTSMLTACLVGWKR